MRKFGGVIEKINKNLESARNTWTRSARGAGPYRKFRDVQELSDADTKLLLKLHDH